MTRFRLLASKHAWLLFALFLGLAIRVAFLMKGATVYYGAGHEYLNGDSFSYTESFRNLVEHGHYTSDPSIPDASFGRLPGYPFFFGLHYLLFGAKEALAALAVSQTLLDTAVILLLYRLLLRWTGQLLPAVFVALLYATYPFAIIWVSVTGTEQLNTFCTVLWLGAVTSGKQTRTHYALVGVLAALAFLVREFMGVLLPISLLVVFLQSQLPWPFRWKRAVWVALGFGFLYIGWPARNYFGQHRLTLVKPVSAGYANQREDMQAYLDWLHCWTNDNTTWLELMLASEPFRYPASIFGSPVEERRAYALTALAARCGSSFHLRRLDTQESRLAQPPLFYNCNPAIAAGFDSLRTSFVRRHPLRYAIAVPLSNLQKAFFKKNTIHQPKAGTVAMLQRALFGYRSVLVLLGVLGLLIARKQPWVVPICCYFLFIYLYTSVVFRSLEMRYLLQADVMLLLPAAWLIARLVKAGRLRKVNHDLPSQPKPIA
jgi:hypothetical protein